MTILCGCTGEGSDIEQTSGSSSDTDTGTEIKNLELVRDGEYLYALVRPEEASETLKHALRLITSGMTGKFGMQFSGGDDWARGDFNNGEYVSDTPEILLGETNRVESREVYLTLNAGEYAIRAVGNKIVILGYNDYLTYLAAEDFVENYINASDGKVFSVAGDLSVLKSPYAAEDPEPVFEIERITPVGEEIRLESEQWLACEIEFTSDKDYTDPVYTVDMDAVFYNEATGTVLTIPAFWDGGRVWKVRFAPTEVGEWKFYTKCTDTENAGLHHRAGSVSCKAYSGDLDIYKHGFIKTVPGLSYFMYDDGTPFFYLGDTHWTLPLEEIDSYGSVETQKTAGITKEIADQYGVTSQFKYIMDYRAEQGYTVIQSQPLGWWTNPGQNGWFADEHQNIFTYGVNDIMLAKFQQYDIYFDYIAEKGFVHSNTQFGYPTALMTEYFAGKITDTELEKLCRYWVARYSAYPVMWATTQEGDNDYYGLDRGDCAATPDNNPWLLVIDYIDKYDAYDHPSTCHQENANNTTVENSSFGKLDSHTWYAAQYNTRVSNGSNSNWNMLRDYWNNPGSKPVVNYEGRYDHFWVGTFGARAQGWLAYMNGQVGYGYGIQPIWSIFWSQNGITNFTGSDENGEFRMDDNWIEGLYSEAGEQVTYIKDFLSEYEWWRLVPCFNNSYFYMPNGSNYSVCHIGNELYLGYFYGSARNNEKLGTLTSMANGEYEVRWFNCQTGEFTEAFKITVTDATYTLPAKPDSGDWVIAVELVK